MYDRKIPSGDISNIPRNAENVKGETGGKNAAKEGAQFLITETARGDSSRSAGLSDVQGDVSNIPQNAEKVKGSADRRLLDLYAAAEAKRYECVNFKSRWAKQLRGARRKAALEFNEKLERTFADYAEKKYEQVRFAKHFKDLADALKNGGDFTIRTAQYFGDVLVECGKTGKDGYGIKHIIEQRFKKDGKSVDEITAMMPLILEAARFGTLTRETNKSMEFERNGIVAIVAKEKFGKEEKWVLTGFDNSGKKAEAEAAIATVIANKGYAPERSYFREQVGAVIASLENVPQKAEKVKENASGIKSLPISNGEIKAALEKWAKKNGKGEAEARENRIRADMEKKRSGGIIKAIVWRGRLYVKRA